MVMDFVGSIDGTPFGGGEGRDQMVELGSGRLIPGFEEQLEGASAGEERTVKVDFPEDYGAEDLAGKSAEFAVTVKEIKAKDLPELDDDLAAEAGFDTLDELREDIREPHHRAGGLPHRRGVPRGRAGLRRRGRRPSRCPTRSSRRAPASCGTRCSTRSRTRASPRRPTCRSPAGARTRSSRPGQGGRRPGAAPRGRAGRDHRGRGHRADRGGAAGGRRRRRPRATRPRSCSSG